MKKKEQIPVLKTNDALQNKKTKEEDVFIREKIEETRKLNDELQNEVYSKEELNTMKNGKKKKKEKVGLKLMLINTIIASFAVVIIVFHLKGYF